MDGGGWLSIFIAAVGIEINITATARPLGTWITPRLPNGLAGYNYLTIPIAKALNRFCEALSGRSASAEWLEFQSPQQTSLCGAD